MQTTRRTLILVVLTVLVSGSLLLLSGCGYAKNVRDDFLDIFVFGVGVTPPVAELRDVSLTGGIIPPSFGLYLEATDFLHLGALYKASGDFEIDRRAVGTVVDRRAKLGFLFAHYVNIYQTPVYTNDYKREGNHLDAWRTYMRSLRDPVFGAPAKELIFRNREIPSPYMYRGWQDWEMFQAEIAIPEPFILHSGVNLRVGFDVSEVFDFALSLVGLDLYGDRAYDWLGNPRRFPSVNATALVPSINPFTVTVVDEPKRFLVGEDLQVPPPPPPPPTYVVEPVRPPY